MVRTTDDQTTLRLIRSLTDDPADDARDEHATRCKALRVKAERFLNTAEAALKVGMLVRWKAGMKNRSSPKYGEPVIVMELLVKPAFEERGWMDRPLSGTPYYREPLDIAIGEIASDGEFLVYHYDRRRFEPYTDQTSTRQSGQHDQDNADV